jgi:hypothetical protein
LANIKLTALNVRAIFKQFSERLTETIFGQKRPGNKTALKDSLIEKR